MKTVFDESVYYDYNKVFSYNRLITMIVSSKGVGKTYGIKRKVIAHFIKTGKQFVWIRRYGTQIDNLKKNDGAKFFEDIKDAFPDRELKMRGTTFFCDGEVMGHALSVSKAGSLTGTSMHNAQYVVFDEFISKGTMDDVYIGKGIKEVEDFLLILDTIIRTRDDVKVFMLGNNHTIVNPYFEYFGIDVKIGQRLHVYKNILVDMYLSDRYIKEREKTSFGQLIRGVEYGTFSLDNQSLIDSEEYIKQRSKHSKQMFNITYKRETITFFADDMTGLYYFSRGINLSTRNTFVMEERDITESSVYVKSWRDARELELVRLAFKEKMIYYDDQYCKQMAFDVMKKLSIL